MRTEQANVASVIVGQRLRPLVPEKVAALAESMKLIGLQNPISVYLDEEDQAHLVAGLHRLEAARSLGWDFIDAVVLDHLSPIDRELWEIDENLARAELTADEKREHLKRRKALWEQRQIAENETGGTSRPTSLSDGRRAGPQHQKNFAADTAASTGLSKRQINRLLAKPKPHQPKPVERGQHQLGLGEVDHAALCRLACAMARFLGRRDYQQHLNESQRAMIAAELVAHVDDADGWLDALNAIQVSIAELLRGRGRP
jgi:hypothetical protein